MGTVLLVIHLLIAIFLVGLILIQRASGGALDGLGGGNSASSFMGAQSTGNFLTRLTAILATAFFITSITLSIHHKGGDTRTRSILDAPAAAATTNIPSAPIAGE